MELVVLVDNNTLIDRYLLGEPGVSYLIESDGRRVLFDVGYSDLFLRNAERLDRDLLLLDDVVLSHGHLDHTWGLQHLIERYTLAQIEGLPYQRPRLVTHPYTFRSKRADGLPEIGSLISQAKAARHFALTLSREPVWLTDRLVYLGQIPRVHDFERSEPLGFRIGRDGTQPDRLLEDSALAYRADEGLVLVVGCAHAGIANIITAARHVCGQERIIDVVGGLHLLDASPEQLDGTCRFLADCHLQALHACHCTGLAAQVRLAQVAPLQEVGVGLKLVYT